MQGKLKGEIVTLTESIARRSAALPPQAQREVLRFVESLSRGRARPRKKQVRVLCGVHPALKPVVGIWADRGDLPADSVEAVKTLRRRSGERRRNG
jgi:hypothetical protein